MPKTVGEGLRHHIALMLAIVMLAILGGAAAVFMTAPRYQAQALVLVDVRNQDAVLRQSDGLLSMQYVQEATSRPVLAQAIASLKLTGSSPDSLGRDIRADLSKAAPVVVITGESNTAAGAAALATAVAHALIDFNRTQASQLAVQQRQYLQSELDRFNAAIAKLGNPAAGTPQQAQLTLLQNEYTATYAHLQDADLAQASAADTLLLQQPASIPTKPFQPDPARYMLVAVLAGIVVAALAALIVDRFDNRLRDADALAIASGAPLGLMVPRQSTFGPQEPAFALLRTALYARSHGGPMTVLLVPVGQGDRTDLVAAGLAPTESDGQRQMAIGGESDMSSFGPALTAVGEQHVSAQSWPEVKILAPLSSHKRKLIDLDEGLTIATVPPADKSGHMFELARKADVALLVATAGRTRFDAARHAAEVLRYIGVEVAASVMLPRNAPDAAPHRQAA